MEPALHVVGYLDLLGQSAAMEPLQTLPRTQEEAFEHGRVVMHHATVVRDLRELLNDWTSYVRAIKPVQLSETVPGQARQDFIRIMSPRVQHIGFSDCFVVSLKVGFDASRPKEPQPSEAVYGIHALLSGIIAVSVKGLAHGIPMRGGVELGLAVDLYPPNEVYGPALVSAYELEQGAEYPRTAVGRNLLAYLTSCSKIGGHPQFEFAATMANQALALICDAPDDRQPMVHFLAPHLAAASAEFCAEKVTAEKWTHEQIDRYRSCDDPESRKRHARYQRLEQYFSTYAAPVGEVEMGAPADHDRAQQEQNSAPSAESASTRSEPQ